jgi:hypothetical protein
MASPSCVIRSGRIDDLPPAPGAWAFVDPGFSRTAKSCCLLIGRDAVGRCLTFGQLQKELVDLISSDGEDLNLVIEAPLSVAMTSTGNPSGRSVERRNGSSRYWYVGAGAAVLLSSLHLMKAIADAPRRREVRLFEGFVSFKERMSRSDHCGDVDQLRLIVFGDTSRGRIVPASELLLHSGDRLHSAFAVAGLELGLPPVVLVTG